MFVGTAAETATVVVTDGVRLGIVALVVAAFRDGRASRIRAQRWGD
ncbi:MAG: hypothetical protein ACOC0X_01735 [Halobacteriota archaeon]